MNHTPSPYVVGSVFSPPAPIRSDRSVFVNLGKQPAVVQATLTSGPSMFGKSHRFLSLLVLVSYSLATDAAWHHVCHDCALHSHDAAHWQDARIDSPHEAYAHTESGKTHLHFVISVPHRKPTGSHSKHDKQNCLLCRFSVQRSPALIAEATHNLARAVEQPTVPVLPAIVIRPLFLPESRAPPCPWLVSTKSCLENV